MIEHIELLNGPFSLSQGSLARTDTDLTTLVRDANRAAICHAKARLGMRMARTAADQLGDYFVEAAVHSRAPHWQPERGSTVMSLVRQLCSRVHSVTMNVKAKGLQIGFLSDVEPLDLAELGLPIEPGSDIYLLSPTSVLAAAEQNLSIEVRVFDRQFSDWAEFADDVSAVTGADIFTKVFLAGGTNSVNGWHRDASDVVVVMLDGKKRFQVATVDSTEEAPVPELDVVLRPGDALLLPRSRLHNAIPMGEVSALLSIGVMRFGDWAYRGIQPTHLGHGNPRSPRHYRLALRAHVPAAGPVVDAELSLRTRLPGGIGIIAEDGSGIEFVAAGRRYRASSSVVRLLASVHSASAISPSQLADGLGAARPWCSSVTAELAGLGLIRTLSGAVPT